MLTPTPATDVAGLFIYGMRDCTIRNDTDSVIRVPVGRREAYVDLSPGEHITIRTVEPDTAWNGDGQGRAQREDAKAPDALQ